MEVANFSAPLVLFSTRHGFCASFVWS